MPFVSLAVHWSTSSSVEDTAVCASSGALPYTLRVRHSSPRHHGGRRRRRRSHRAEDVGSGSSASSASSSSSRSGRRLF